MTREKQYTLATQYKNGAIVPIPNLQPMTHKQATTMRSKISDYPARIVHIVEVTNNKLEA